MMGKAGRHVKHKQAQAKTLEGGTQSICILSLSPVADDGRVLRQISYLSQRYELTVAGYGRPHPDWAGDPRVHYVALTAPPPIANLAAALKARRFAAVQRAAAFAARRIGFQAMLYAGILWPGAYAAGYAWRWEHVLRRVHTQGRRYAVYHANDWSTLPFAAEAAHSTGARLVVDLHEYAPRQYDNQIGWWRYKAYLYHVFHHYMRQADATTTVAPLIAERYHDEFGFVSQVVLNAPEAVPLPARGLDPANIRIVHHGIASPSRRPELMIETIALCEPRYSLHLMFMPSPYVKKLKKFAERIAPGRVVFHDPVRPEQIVSKIAEFDIGFVLMAPTTTNYRLALPNKFFESIVAGLAVMIGPSPSMKVYVQQYGVGVVAPSFEPRDLASLFNAVTAEEWQAMQQDARSAASHLNAANEMQKVLDIYANLLDKQ